ncbi:pilus assembly protein TadG-related protein [Zestomonas thermotolerans]|uniref:pilus assembly protein TadG-related protein n=1 Tax=Zestomonas thermotolerans TaxID=157784 RepID=UPI00037EFF2B|nr:pilus assembly protein TadG-related protein [Pseudomonas thermotolerans]
MRHPIDLSPHSQRGAFSILTTLVLLLVLGFLALALDSGRLYLEKRRLQKVADTAALEAITRLPLGDCSAAPADAQQFASENALRNGFDPDADDRSLAVQCVTTMSSGGLRDAVADSHGRAVRVEVQHRVPTSLVMQASSLFSPSIPNQITLRARAVAEREEPSASFSVGAQLLRLDNGRLLGRLLATVGLDPATLTVLDSNGLANASISPAGLLDALGVDIGIEQLKVLSPEGLLDLVQTQVGLLGIDELLDLSLEVVSDSVLRADLALVRQQILGNPVLRDVRLSLFDTPTQPGLLSLTTTPDGEIGPALDTRVNLSELLKTALLIGANQQGLQLHQGLLNTAQLELGIVRPPSIGIGPVGTTAYNAQIRLHLSVDTKETPLLGGLLAGLGVRVHLPIWIDLVTGHGTLESLDCTGAEPLAEIDVVSRVGNVCLGDIPAAARWSDSRSCESDLQSTELIRASLPLVGGFTLDHKLHLPALEANTRPPLAFETVPQRESTAPNNFQLAKTVDRLLDEIMDLIKPSAFKSEGLLGGVLGSLLDLVELVLDPLVNVLKPIVSGLLSPLGGLLDSVINQLLGLEIGRTDVQLQSVSCGIPKLVR